MTVPSESQPIGRRRAQGRNLFYFRTSLEGWAPHLFREGRQPLVLCL